MGAMQTTKTHSLLVRCPCGVNLRVRPSLIGKKVRCPKCGDEKTAQAKEDPFNITILEEFDAPQTSEENNNQVIIQRPIRHTPRSNLFQIGFKEGLVMGIASLIMLYCTVSIASLLPLFMHNWTKDVIPPMMVFTCSVFGALSILSLLFLLRWEPARILLIFGCAIAAFASAWAAMMSASLTGVLIAGAWGAAALMFHFDTAANYTAGGPPHPKVSLPVTGIILAITLLVAGTRYTDTASKINTVEEVIQTIGSAPSSVPIVRE
jgi:hypothetical protein